MGKMGVFGRIAGKNQKEKRKKDLLCMACGR